MKQYFSNHIHVLVRMSNDKTKLKGPTDIDTSTLAPTTDFFSLETKVDDLDIDKLQTVPTNLSKISNAVDNNVVKKTIHHKLVIKVNAIDNSILGASGLAF